MSNYHRSFSRKSGEKRYRKCFVLATEGRKTEKLYFEKLRNDAIHIEYVKGKDKSAPCKVLARMRQHLEKNELADSDEAWLVVDKDNWPEEQLKELFEWSQKANNYNVAVSNPKFEFWLLLHYEDGNSDSAAKNCEKLLEDHRGKDDKGIGKLGFDNGTLNLAIQRAKRYDNPPCKDWPQTRGSTVYRLIEKILNVTKQTNLV